MVSIAAPAAKDHCYGYRNGIAMFHLTVPFLTAHWPVLFALAALAFATRPTVSGLARVRVRTDANHRRTP
jgi:hypothetical protein